MHPLLAEAVFASSLDAGEPALPSGGIQMWSWRTASTHPEPTSTAKAPPFAKVHTERLTYFPCSWPFELADMVCLLGYNYCGRSPLLFGLVKIDSGGVYFLWRCCKTNLSSLTQYIILHASGLKKSFCWFIGTGTPLRQCSF